MATVQQYPPVIKPIGPGFYFVAEQGEQPHLVQIGIENDSHNMYYVLLPDDDYKYDLGLWENALWFGPIDK
jgi:hypothetical protein